VFLIGLGLVLCGFGIGYSLARSKHHNHRARLCYAAAAYLDELQQLNVDPAFKSGAESFAESIKPYV